MQKADLKRLSSDGRKGGARWLGAGLSWSHGSCDCEEAVHCVRHATPQRKSLLFFFKQEVLLRKFHFYEWNQRINSEADPAMIWGFNRVI